MTRRKVFKIKFLAFSSTGVLIITDDYTKKEVKKGIHIKNIIYDFKKIKDRNFTVNVLDQENNLVKTLKF